jgi:DNA-binding response OmpR family regulator
VAKILIVDDDVELSSNLAQILSDAGYQSYVANCCGDALGKASAEDFDVVLLDMIMPNGSGIDCLVELKKKNPRARTIVVTAFATIKNAVNVIKRGASDYLVKPFKIEELLTAIRQALEEASFEKRGDKRSFHDVLSSLSSPIRTEIMRLLHKREHARLIEITKELGIEDRTKVLFHLKKLQESGIVEHNRDNLYSLTTAGERSLACLRILETHLASTK